MKYFIISILLLICSCRVHAQGGESKWIKPPVFNFEVASAVYYDAEVQNIVSDRIVISFTVDEKCQIHNFAVSQGKIKSFSEWAKKESDVITREWLKKYPCTTAEKKTVRFPITVNFNQP